MATRAITEYDGKRLLARWIAELSQNEFGTDGRCIRVDKVAIADGYATLESKEENGWLMTERLVVKPDQVIKRRGKAGLVGLNLTWQEVKQWITERMDREVLVGQVKGVLNSFIVEPFVPHEQDEEMYVSIFNTRQGEKMLFYHEGGVDVGDVDAKAEKIDISLDHVPTVEELSGGLLKYLAPAAKPAVGGFLVALLRMYRELHFAYLEINPLVVPKAGGKCVPLDLAAKVDETAEYLCGQKWDHLTFPPVFGLPLSPAESYIRDLDSKTGASLKLTILNPKGRVWTMVAGGGASVVYADTISDLGAGHELANYGEYSGAPSEEHTYEYARTLLGLMTASKDPRGKILIIGGGIANFTDVAKTFKGIVKALREYSRKLRDGNVTIWVRRGGPNYQEGLRLMKELGEELDLPFVVHGPDENIVRVVALALGYGASAMHQPIANIKLPPSVSESEDDDPVLVNKNEDVPSFRPHGRTVSTSLGAYSLFSATTRALVHGLQKRAVQGMLDFDYLCKRQKPSVAGMIYPFSGDHYVKFYWGKEEMMIPVYKKMEDAIKKNPDVDVLVNFASFRSAYDVTMKALDHSNQIKTIAIIAEGIPERNTRSIIQKAEQAGVNIIGPATVGGIKPGCFRIGNTGGMIDNIVASKLYRPGSVAYVSRSGGMSNELNSIICHNSDGVCEGVAIGGDRYPGSRFIDHLLRFEQNPKVKILVLLGEVGGVDEYEVCEAIKSGLIKKPLIAWCIGTCAKIFPYDIQFGHAGSLANQARETAEAKNRALKKAGALVPPSFSELGNALKAAFNTMVANGSIEVLEEPPVPVVPMDFTWAKKLGMVRKPAAFVSSICDDRGEELLYAGMPISKVFEDDIGIGGVISLLWFRRRLPAYAAKFIEIVLMVTADHGPAVSGAHNTIVTARAGKDLISSLVSGLLTIGPRFGGALDEAAKSFSKASDRGISPRQFVNEMRAQHKLIMGIGHKIKSVQNPDKRVTIITEFAKKHFPSTEVLDFGLGVEKVTTQKKNNLILNVDGAIACCFVDLLRTCGAFEKEEADEAIMNGCLNGLFVLGRSAGFIAHFLDQKRLKQGLYRHPWDDISYQLPESSE